MARSANGVPSSAGRVRQWIRTRLVGCTEIHLPTLHEETVQWVLGQRGLTESLLRELMRDLVYDIVQRLVATTRKDLVFMGEDLREKEPMIQRAALKWARWLEHTQTKHVIAMEMTRQDCLEAAAQRFLQAERGLALGHLWAYIGEHLQDGERVRDRYTPEDVEQLFQSAQSGNMTLRMGERTWARRLLGRREI